MRDLSRDIVVVWNHGVQSLNTLSRGGDWIKFFKVQFYSLHIPLMLTKHEKTSFLVLLAPNTKKKNRLLDHYIS